MMTSVVKIAIALCLVLLLTGCSSPKKQNLINKRPLVIKQEAQSQYGNDTRIVQLDNGTYIYHDRAYPGL